jgi:hypothetical protein
MERPMKSTTVALVLVVLAAFLVAACPSQAWAAIEVASGDPLEGNSWGTNFYCGGTILDRIEIAILGDDNDDTLAGPGAEFTTDASGTVVRDPGWSVGTFTSKAITLLGGGPQENFFMRMWLSGAADDGNRREWLFKGFRSGVQLFSDKLTWYGDSKNCFDYDITADSGAPVPEPGSVVVWSLLAGLGLIAARRRGARRISR